MKCGWIIKLCETMELEVKKKILHYINDLNFYLKN